MREDGGMKKRVQNGVDEGKWVVVLDCDQIKPSVTYAWSEGAVLLRHKEKLG